MYAQAAIKRNPIRRNGATNIVRTWDAYLSQMKTMGVQEYIDIYQTALDRYNAR